MGINLKMNHAIIAILLLFICACKAVEKKCSKTVMLQSFDRGIYITVGKRMYEKLQSDEFLILKCKDCIGNISAKYFINNALFAQGNFIGTGDTLESDVTQVNPVTYDTKVVKMKNFDALKNGEWQYYDKNKKVLKLEQWQKGNIVETKVFWNTSDSSQYYVIRIDPITYEAKKVKNKYFDLTKEGKILYYDNKKKLIKIENWKDGILIN